jgi:hypothetical protein
MNKDQETEYAHAIMHMFRYNYGNAWAPEAFILGRDRVWNKVFNDLLKQGLIERRKTFHGYQYRWKAVYPE